MKQKPHNLKDGDFVKIESIRDSSNTDGTFGKGYNVETTVTVEDVGSRGANNNNMKFSYSAPVTVNSNRPLILRLIKRRLVRHLRYQDLRKRYKANLFL